MRGLLNRRALVRGETGMIHNPADATAVLYLSEIRTMYIGRLAPVLSQASAASMLILSLDDTLEIIDNKNGSRYESRSFLVPAGSQATINTNNSLIMLCFLNVLGSDLAILKTRMKRTIPISDDRHFYADMVQEAEVIRSGLHIYDFTSPAEFAFAQLQQWIGEPDQNCDIDYDPRVEKAIELVKASILENRPVESIASELNLSVPRLSQIFKRVTGVPIRRFRLWHRIFITAVKMAWGMSLTEASVSSGFSDSAHFSRVFKEIGGVKPSTVLNAKNDTLILMLPPIGDIQSRDTETLLEGNGKEASYEKI